MRADWPNNARTAISLTFDVDAESGWLGEDPAYKDRLSTLSEARYGITRGLPRILSTLAKHDIKATFYVPGYTAELHRDAIKRIAAEGHEIGHHGYLHLRSDGATEAQQREEIERGTAALVQTIGQTPIGYRSPSWELTPITLQLLREHGFTYDSSLMGDDRPYLLGNDLIELPVHWSLDDWPHLHWKPGRGDAFTAPEAFLDTWLKEFESAHQERRHLTYTMHPEVIGRGHRIALIDRLIDEIKQRADVWFATHADVAAFVTS
ncbi:polysaccharide deacetylase [Solirubrobacter phytolaccae]|uniref:Polysaccharide deacetylase n=1 Tax=Solirubrobacter phytolaccae TaxID=1404360 RepID=A0A9X3SBE5_9ACTN|nr:polysaccharide deacetylase [Solirubrobacter phytolaccae]MDA0181310.1 polysaccharide deacetylase [Solirubrobacter phytolaccae]